MAIYGNFMAIYGNLWQFYGNLWQYMALVKIEGLIFTDLHL
jgi:hypothetical protein